MYGSAKVENISREEFNKDHWATNNDLQDGIVKLGCSVLDVGGRAGEGGHRESKARVQKVATSIAHTIKGDLYLQQPGAKNMVDNPEE